MSKKNSIKAAAKSGETSASEHAMKMHQAVQKSVAADPRFNTQKPDAPYKQAPYVTDITTRKGDNHNGPHSAIVSTADGKLVKHPFDYDADADEATLHDGEPQETERSTVYSKAIEDFREQERVQAAGTSDGAGKGHATRKTATAMEASQEAHRASLDAVVSQDHIENNSARQLHHAASEAHEAAMLAHAAGGNKEQATKHAKAMLAHDACAAAHASDQAEADGLTSSLKELEKLEIVKSTKPAEPAAKQIVDVVHCRANGSKLRADKAPDWRQDEPVKFCYMPAGIHTVNAGFSGPITKGRSSSINLTVEVDPERDAATCQASLEEMLKDEPKQAPYGCFEHDEKQASVWATNFEAGEDPVYGEPCVLLGGKPSRGGAEAVNGRDWRSWSPSFATNAEYTKCKCRRCDDNIKACDCAKPAFYFPPEAVGSEEKPAQITGIDFVLGTLTNKPAFRAMPPVKARQQETVKADDQDGDPEMPEHPGAKAVSKEADHVQSLSHAAHLKSKMAEVLEDHHPDGVAHGSKQTAHLDATAAHKQAAAHATTEPVKDYHDDAADFHSHMAAEHGKVTAKDGTMDDLDVILAKVKPMETVDQVLARYEQDGGRVSGYAAELALADEILARIKV